MSVDHTGRATWTVLGTDGLDGGVRRSECIHQEGSAALGILGKLAKMKNPRRRSHGTNTTGLTGAPGRCVMRLRIGIAAINFACIKFLPASILLSSTCMVHMFCCVFSAFGNDRLCKRQCICAVSI